MTDTKRPSFDDLADYIDAETFAAMQRVSADRYSSGLNTEKEEDAHAIAQLRKLRDDTGVCFIRNDRADGWIEFTRLGGMYVMWREAAPQIKRAAQK